MTIARRSSPLRPWSRVAVLAAVLIGCSARAHADASTVPTGFVDQSMLSSLDEPVGIVEVPDPPSFPVRRVLFVEQRTARVGLVVGTTEYTVGTVPGVYSGDNERGLLGIAVDPGWPARPYIYTHSTDNRSGQRIVISRFTLTGDLAGTGNKQLSFNPASRYDLITRIPDNVPYHNGGTVRFGPDQRLYVSLGDDGTLCGAQDLRQLAGKILRLDVSRLPFGPGGPAPTALLEPAGNPFAANADSNAKLVWTEGLRNPFRFQIDRTTGVLYISDVGQDRWEELDRADAAGMDMGWPINEGPVSYSTCSGSPPAPLTGPIAYYDHATGQVIICGGLYRGLGLPGAAAASAGDRVQSVDVSFPAEYEGDCFFHDYYTGIMRRLKGSGTTWSLAPPVAGQPDAQNWGLGFDFVSDMLELSDGSLWYCRQFVDGNPGTGEIRRIVHPPTLDVPVTSTADLALAAPRPSPSHGSVTIEWTQPRAGSVRLAIFDLGGRLIRQLETGAVREAGTHRSTWDGRDDSGRHGGPGLYFVRLDVGGDRRQARLTMLP